MATIIQQTGCSPCAAKRAAMGLSGIEDIFGQVLNVGHTIWGDVTGATANQKAQENALELQKIQAEAAVAEAQARSATVMKVVPWVAGGVVVLLGSVVAIKLLSK